VQGSLTQGKVPRDKRRTEAGSRGDRGSGAGAWPIAADRAKHQAGAARLNVGMAQTEHQNSPCSSRPNDAVKPVAGGNPA
jgi:hypothetical protein